MRPLLIPRVLSENSIGFLLGIIEERDARFGEILPTGTDSLANTIDKEAYWNLCRILVGLTAPEVETRLNPIQLKPVILK